MTTDMHASCSRLVALFLLASWSAAQAEETLPGPIPATVERIIDGDTLDVVARIWPGLETRARVRLASVDTPELGSPCPNARKLAQTAQQLVEQTLRDKPITLVHIRPEHAYGRILADVEMADGTDIGAVLLQRGLARPFHTKVRCDWCAAAPRCNIAK